MNKLPQEVIALVTRAENLICRNNLLDLLLACDVLDNAQYFLPENPVLLIIRGKVLNQLGNFESANSDFKKAVELAPDYAAGLLKTIELGKNCGFMHMFINMDEMPPIFHITHWKAGSQWVKNILYDCFPEHLFDPEIDIKIKKFEEFSDLPKKNGIIYSPLYIDKQTFDGMKLPPKWKCFVIIRDLRDTLISAYFSFKVSHPLFTKYNVNLRNKLISMDMEKGFMYLMENWLPACAIIQESWIESREEVIKYEDLLFRDIDILSRLLIDRSGLPVSNERLKNNILTNRFESLTGRKPGHEMIDSHMRKATQGDWKNHFTRNLKEAFKERYGALLIKTGYEHDYEW
jgi:hypothetical protein